jgi:trans-aconitate methyltransferase
MSELSSPLMYTSLAPWFHLVTAPEEYAEEADFYRHVLQSNSQTPIRTLLELGSGGGNNASHLKRIFDMTLVDLSTQMLELSRGLNPECEHIQGDMRTVRLNREFDAVFVHDAIMYMTTETDLKKAMETAFVHLNPGGVALFAPDCLRETFKPSTDHGGHDGRGEDRRALRYLEWNWDPDPDDTTYIADYVYLLRDQDENVQVIHDRHTEGLFPRDTWFELLREIGFASKAIPFIHSEVEPGTTEVFIGQKRGL